MLERLQNSAGGFERLVVYNYHRVARQVLRLVKELEHEACLLALHSNTAAKATRSGLSFFNWFLNLALLFSGGQNARRLSHMLRHDNWLVTRIQHLLLLLIQL